MSAANVTMSVYKEVFGEMSLDTNAEIVNNFELIEIAYFLPPAMRDTLRAAFTSGPLFDGDVPSKSARDFLVENRLMAHVIVKGEWGYNACTYRGAWVHKLICVINAHIDRIEGARK